MTTPPDPSWQGQPDWQAPHNVPPGYGTPAPQQGGYPQPGAPSGWGPPPGAEPGYGPPAGYGQPGHGPPPGYGPPPGAHPPPPGGSGLSIAAVRSAYADARPPKEVHQAFRALMVALAIGVLSSIVGLVFTAMLLSNLSGGYGLGGSVFSLIITLIIYGLAVFVAVQMRAGRSWARTTIAVLGGIGLVLGVVGLFASFGLAAAVYGGLYTTLTLLLNVVQLALIAAALYLMFRPNVNGYFR